MSFQEKNITVSLGSFILILAVYLIRLFQMLRDGGLNSTGVFRLWGTVIVLAIVFTIFATILTHIVSAIMQAIAQAIKTGKKDPDIEIEIDDLQDERDKLIDLRGTKATYFVSSIGVGLAMLTYVLGRPPLVMFTSLIFVGIVAQIVGDISRLILYRRGF